MHFQIIMRLPSLDTKSINWHADIEYEKRSWLLDCDLLHIY